VAESTVRWFVVREKHSWMAVDSTDKSKRTGCELALIASVKYMPFREWACGPARSVALYVFRVLEVVTPLNLFFACVCGVCRLCASKLYPIKKNTPFPHTPF
jgi:hypothetical protein